MLNNDKLSFLTESTGNFEETQTIGSFSAGKQRNNFDEAYDRAYQVAASASLDPMVDIAFMIKQPHIMESFKEELLSELKSDCAKFDAMDDSLRYSTLCEQVSAMVDNCVSDFIAESARVGNLLPIKAIDLPIIVKQNIALCAKDIIQTEVTKSPVIKKHIERRWIVDKKSNKRWEYPQCFFKEDFRDIYNAGKGWPIKDTPVDITNNLIDYNIAENLTDSPDYTREKLSENTRVVKAIVTKTVKGEDGADDKTETVEIPINMRINLSDGQWLGGEVRDPETKDVIDVLYGSVDFITMTVNLSSLTHAVTAVVFEGYLSNENNERTTTWDRTREEYEWKIEDGFRIDVPYSLEQLEDHKALADLDLYKRTYDDLTNILVQMEDNGVLDWLDKEYDRWKGVEVDPLSFSSFIREQTFDCDPRTQTTALRSEYINKELKFLVDRFIIDIADSAKMENISFVCYGNPRYVSLLDPFVNWVVKSGDTVGGVKLNYSYGVMNAGGVKIQVVSTAKYDSKKLRKLRFIPFPLGADQFTFKHYKYTSHIVTGQNSNYRAADLPGGSMTYLMGTTRNVTASIQGIQGSISFENAPFILDD